MSSITRINRDDMLELTTSAVTGRRSNQLSHWALQISLLLEDYHIFKTTYMLTKQSNFNHASVR